MVISPKYFLHILNLLTKCSMCKNHDKMFECRIFWKKFLSVSTVLYILLFFHHPDFNLTIGYNSLEFSIRKLVWSKIYVTENPQMFTLCGKEAHYWWMVQDMREQGIPLCKDKSDAMSQVSKKLIFFEKNWSNWRFFSALVV